MALQITHWNRVTHILIWVSIAVFIVFILIYTPIILHALKIGELYFTFFRLVASATFWFYLPLTLTLILLPAWIAKVIQWTYFPRDWQVLREIERSGGDVPRAQHAARSHPSGKARVAVEMNAIA